MSISGLCVSSFAPALMVIRTPSSHMRSGLKEDLGRYRSVSASV